MANVLLEYRAKSQQLHLQILWLGILKSTLIGYWGKEHFVWAIFSTLVNWTFRLYR